MVYSRHNGPTYRTSLSNKCWHSCSTSSSSAHGRGVGTRRRSSRSASSGGASLGGFDPQPIQFEKLAPFLEMGSATIPDTSSSTTTRPLVTLATQTSLDRWPAFAQQAGAWGGPASVAVYCPCPASSPCAQAVERLVAGLVSEYGAAHPNQRVTVSLLYARHYAREGASELPQVCSWD